MEVKYDKIGDSKYIRIRKGAVEATKKETDWLLFDLAKNGDILGVEILEASRHLVSISTVGDKVLGYQVLETKDFGRGEKRVAFEVKNNLAASLV